MKQSSKTIRKILVIALLAVGLMVVSAMNVHAQEASAQGAPVVTPAPATATQPPAQPSADAIKPASDTPDTAKKPDVSDTSADKTGSTALGSSTFGAIVGNNDSVTVKFAEILALFLRLISQILFPLLMFAGGLLKSDFLYTGAVDLKLSEMWVQVRNLVNIAYVLLLLVVALYNVLGLGELVSVLELKKALPKIILGLILVNFSYAGVKVVLDVVNVGTTFAFSIGRSDADLTQRTAMQIAAAQGEICREMGASRFASAIETSKEVLTDCVKKSKEKDPEKAKALCKEAAEKSNEINTENGICRKNSDGSYKLAPEVTKYLTNWNIDGSLMIIALKFMNIQKLGLVAAEVQKGGISSLAINMLFSVVMYLIYAVSFIVLTITLFIRAAVLWMVIIFSPLLVLNTTFPNLIPGGASGFAGKITKSLIAPIILGFILSIGYILLATMQNVNYEGLGGVPVGAPTSSIDTFQDLLVAIGAIVFVWLGIKAANDGTIADNIAGKVIENAQGAGEWLAKAPFLYTPFFQISSPHSVHHGLEESGKTTEELKVTDIPNLLSQLKNKSENESYERARKFLGNTDVSVDLKNMTSVEHLKDAISKLDRNQLEASNNLKDFTTGLEKVYGQSSNRNMDIGGGVTVQRLYDAREDTALRDGLIQQARTALRSGTTSAGAATASAGSLTDPQKTQLTEIAEKFSNSNTTHIQNLASIVIEQNKTATGSSATEKGENIAQNLKNGVKNWSDAKKGKLADAIESNELKQEIQKTLKTDEASALLREIEAALRKL
jgi:hypothetical protein